MWQLTPQSIKSGTSKKVCWARPAGPHHCKQPPGPRHPVQRVQDALALDGQLHVDPLQLHVVLVGLVHVHVTGQAGTVARRLWKCTLTLPLWTLFTFVAWKLEAGTRACWKQASRYYWTILHLQQLGGPTAHLKDPGGGGRDPLQGGRMDPPPPPLPQ